MISSLKKRKEKKGKREKRESPEGMDGSVGRSRRWNSLLPSVAFGKEGARGGWKKDGKDESEALQLGGVVLN